MLPTDSKMHYYEIDMFIPREIDLSILDMSLQIHSDIDFCKIDIFIAGLARIDIERCHRAWQGEDLC